jgi:PAS domain S-box-containing protein
MRQWNIAIVPELSAISADNATLSIVHRTMDHKSPPSGNEPAADPCLSERRWRRMHRLARIGIWDWDQRTDQVWFSDEALKLFGLAAGPNERSFAEWIVRVHPEDRDRVDRIAQENRGKLSSYELTYRTIHSDGTVRHLHEYVEALLDESGAWIGTSGATQDVTEWHEAQLALRASEARWHSFMTHAPVCITVKDTDGAFLSVNPASEAAFGRQARDILGRRTCDLSRSAGSAAIGEMEREVIATGRVVTREVHFDDRCDAAWTYEVKFPIFDQNGSIAAIGGFAIDISEQKKAERARQQTEALLHAFMDNAPFEMVVKDLADRYLMVNRGMSNAWGLPIDAFIGRRLSEIRETPGVDLVEALDREVMETGTTVTREINYADFGDYWSRAVKFPIRDPEGRIVAVGGISIDISESKRAERETVDAKEQAVSASQAKSMFLANMSHELRTPLNAIIGFSDIIAQQLYGPSSDRYVRYANDIMDSAHHLLGIVNSILDTTKIEAGKFQLAEELCSIYAVVDSAARMLSERAESKHVKLESRVAPDLPPIRADERALRQILINLMFNAVKFTHMGGCVMVTADTAPDGSLRLRVDDTGVGIAADDMAKVFDRFSQIGDAYTRLQGGTGLGLHVSRKLVELHQGTIEVDSTPGTGTTVTVLLPAWRWSEIPKQRPVQTA